MNQAMSSMADSLHDSEQAATVGRLWLLEGQFLRPHRFTMAWAAAGMLVSSVLLLPIPLMQGTLIDRLVAPDDSAAQFDIGRLIIVTLVASLVCYLGRTLLSWKIAATMSRVSLEVVRELTDAMHRKLQRLPMAYYHREQTGRIMARLTSDVGSLLIFLNHASLQLASDLILAVGMAFTMAWLDWRLSLLVIATAPFFALNHHFFMPRSRAASARVRAQVAAIYALLSERLSAIRVVRSFAHEEEDLSEFARRLQNHSEASLDNHRMTAFQSAIALLVSGVGTVAVLTAGMTVVRAGDLSIGELLAFYALAVQFFAPIVRLAHFHGIISATSIAADGIAEIFDEPETLRDGTQELAALNAPGALEFDDVTFAYPGDAHVLRNISIRVEPGRTLGILGPSGAGKSTLLALAARLHDVAANMGSIRVGGVDVRDLRLADLRQCVVIVPQNAMLFDGTIRSNLTFACTAASESAIRKVLEITELADFVAGLPLGLETPVVERGANLSGGQRQRIALARALLTDPAILLLDDCTSALDAVTETRILTAFSEHLPGRTRVIVSHKIAAVAGADEVIVINRGQIVERGNPRALANLGGFYAQCVALQFPGMPLPAPPAAAAVMRTSQASDY